MRWSLSRGARSCAVASFACLTSPPGPGGSRRTCLGTMRSPPSTLSTRAEATSRSCCRASSNACTALPRRSIRFARSSHHCLLQTRHTTSSSRAPHSTTRHEWRMCSKSAIASSSRTVRWCCSTRLHSRPRDICTRWRVSALASPCSPSAEHTSRGHRRSRAAASSTTRISVTSPTRSNNGGRCSRRPSGRIGSSGPGSAATSVHRRGPRTSPTLCCAHRPDTEPSARVHYHTDCYWFGGSEVALLVHLEAAFQSDDVDPVFTYRAGSEYEAGLRAQAGPAIHGTRLRLPDPADLKDALSRKRSPRVGKALRGGVSLLPLRQLCMAWDVGRMFALFRNGKPDVVHINNGGYPGAISCSAAAIAARLAGVPAVVYVVNNIAVPYERPSRVLDYPIDRIVVRSVDVFVTASKIASSALESVLRLPPAQHTVIANGAAAGDGGSRESARQALAIPNDRLVLLVMARLEQRKGHAVLLEAIPLLPAQIRDRVLVLIAGDGPEKDALSTQAERLNIAGSVQLLGHREDRWSLYAAADILVLPSIGHEDMPIVIIDAMAASRPVVATR